VEQHLSFPKPVYHYSTIDFIFEVTQVIQEDNRIEISVEARDEREEIVISGVVTVLPPKVEERLTSQAMDNF